MAAAPALANPAHHSNPKALLMFCTVWFEGSASSIEISASVSHRFLHG
ncbi:MAG: hypothetical protein AAGD22_14920 [Verrucomicrobiota bacterium]